MITTVRTFDLRLQTLQDGDKPMLELPIVFTGTFKECERLARIKGFTFKANSKMLYGGYWNSPDRTASLIMT